MKRLSLQLFLAFLAGGFYALAYPSFLGLGWFPLLFLSVPLFLWLFEKAPFKLSLLFILAFNFGLNTFGYYWIPHTLREFGELPYVVSFILGSSACLILQPHWWPYALWKKYRPLQDWQSEKNVLLSALILTILERFVPQQFPSYVGSPWLHLAPYLGLAPYFGVVIFSFMTYWFSLEVIIQLEKKQIRPLMWICVGLFLLLNFLQPLKIPETAQKIPVRIVQANIGNFLKVSSEKGDANSYEQIEKTYEELSLRSNGFTPKLIIWPETAYPDTFYGLESGLAPVFQRIIDGTNAEILLGGYDQDPTKSSYDFIESVFNSSLLLSGTRVKSVYHKNILIPFGETLPFGPLNRKIVSLVPAVSLFARGIGTPLMETNSGLRFVTPICYEILETNYMRELLNQWGGNHFIINHTNDSWYGETAEPFQHLFLSKWRALEFQLPIIRSTNTGISSILFQDGSESKRLSSGEVGLLDVELSVSKPHSTLYQDFGALSFVLVFTMLFLVVWWRERKS
jgi:apolipoprotein N-acyltransferase